MFLAFLGYIWKFEGKRVVPSSDFNAKKVKVVSSGYSRLLLYFFELLITVIFGFFFGFNLFNSNFWHVVLWIVFLYVAERLLFVLITWDWEELAVENKEDIKIHFKITLGFVFFVLSLVFLSLSVLVFVQNKLSYAFFGGIIGMLFFGFTTFLLLKRVAK
ncbi:MAG: hypothetical protein HQL69_08740 [Magnetococcales bacterium]|nr:hypothetical protein [Magnetococcales bacterium]